MSQAAGKLTLLGLIAALVLALAGCGSPRPAGIYKLGQPYQIAGRWYYPDFDPHYDRVGLASWYGVPFHGRATANGEVFDRAALTAAHPTLPLPSIVRVTNLANRRQVDLRVNDRGPFVDDRLIDLSQARRARARLRAPGARAGARRVREPRRGQGRAAPAAVASGAGARAQPGHRCRATAVAEPRAAAAASAAVLAAAPVPAHSARDASSRSAPSPSPSAPGTRRSACTSWRRRRSPRSGGQRSAVAGPGRPDRRSALGRGDARAAQAAAAMPAPSCRRRDRRRRPVLRTARPGRLRAWATWSHPHDDSRREESMVTRLWSAGRSIVVLLILLTLATAGRGVRDAGAGGDPARSRSRSGAVREERRRAAADRLDEQADDRLHGVRAARGRADQPRRHLPGQREGLAQGRLEDVRRGRRQGAGRGPACAASSSSPATMPASWSPRRSPAARRSSPAR